MIKLDNAHDIKFKGYMIKLEPEEEQILFELGRDKIKKNKTECINYALKYLLTKYLDGEI